MRININLDEDLIKEIDERAKSLHLSRSSYIALSCANYNRLHDRMLDISAELDKHEEKYRESSEALKRLYDKLKNK